MKKNVSKYDILDKKIKNIFMTCMPSYLKMWTSITNKQYWNGMQELFEKLFDDAHVVFEINNDVKDYGYQETYSLLMRNQAHPISFLRNLSNANNQLYKMLLLEALLKEEGLDGNPVVVWNEMRNNNFIQELCNRVTQALFIKHKDVMLATDLDDFNFSKLPKHYQEMIIKNHREYMDKNVYPLVNIKESKEVELLKASKIIRKKMNVNLNLSINGADVTKKVK